MKIRFHIGTEKTGSSFIQSSWALNRDFLQHNGVYFPSAARRESDMITGRISPGNAKPLSVALMRMDKKGTKQVMSRWLEEARERNCSTLLLSNENLTEAFSEGLRMELLLQVLKELGAEFYSALLFLREPVEQAISLYKHRGRKGKVDTLNSWMENGYELPKHLNGVYKVFGELKLTLVSRKYIKNSDILERVVYREWLAIDVPVKKVKKKVNPSLTLDEIELMRAIFKYDSQLVHELYDQLLAIPIERKVTNLPMKEYYSVIVGNHILCYEELWKTINKKLPKCESLSIPNFKENYSYDDELRFSKEQLQVIAGYVFEASTIAFIVRVFLRKVRTKVSLFRIHLKNIIEH